MLKGVCNLKRATIVLVFALCFSALFALSLGEGAIAETRNVKTTVTVKPSLLLNIPSNNITMNLDPSSHDFDEKTLTIKVGTNNLYGYKLYLTTPNDDTNLANVVDNTKTIPNLTNSYSPSDFGNCSSTDTDCINKWGYRFNLGSTSSGDYGRFSSSDSTPIMESDVPVNETTATLGFAAKIDYTKPAGLYNLKLNFKAVPTVTTNYMQDIAADPTLAASVCTEEPTVVIDKRDEQAYTIRRINGDCWMVENLQFTGTTMDSTTTNIAPEYTPSNPYVATYYDLETDGTTGGACNQNSGAYDYSCIHRGDITIQNTPIDSSVSFTTISTVWYNYAAATAGTITGNPNTNPTEYDICPKGWKLPSDADVLSIGDMTNTYIPEFNPTSGGRYYNGVIHNGDTDRGYWWGTATKNNRERRFLYYNNLDPSAPYLGGPGGWYRSSGNYIRCVMDDFGINDLTYMQDFANITSAHKTQVTTSMEEEKSYQLIDTRESGANAYYVAKLKDNKVWMLQNLKLGSTLNFGTSGTNTSLSLTTTDTDGDFVLTNRRNDNTDNPLMEVNTRTDDPIATAEGASAVYVMDKSNFFCPFSGSVSGDNYEGCYYNWYTATAGSGYGEDINGHTATPANVNADNSICPSGWNLPKGGASSDFEALIAQYPSASQMLVNPATDYDNASGAYKPGFLLSGYCGNKVIWLGTGGTYWSSTSYSIGWARYMKVDSSNAPHQAIADKRNGLSIRCIAK